MTMHPLVRPRSEGDIPPCVELLSRVHEIDRYPTYWPPDSRRFVAPPYERAAWVAGEEGAVIGHIALHDARQDPGCPLAYEETGLATEQLVAVGRLFTDPGHRGLGVGRRLLEAATEEAHGQGLRPFLNVVRHLNGARALYEASGWADVGPLLITLDDGRTLDSSVFVGPAGT